MNKYRLTTTQWLHELREVCNIPNSQTSRAFDLVEVSKMTPKAEIKLGTETHKITANEITIVDRKGKPRIRMAVEEDGTAAVKFFDGSERLRMALYLKEYDPDDEGYLFEEGSDNDSGLLVTGRRSGAAVRLGISEDGLFGKRPRLEITEGGGYGKTRHRFPPRPPNSSD